MEIKNNEIVFGGGLKPIKVVEYSANSSVQIAGRGHAYVSIASPSTPSGYTLVACYAYCTDYDWILCICRPNSNFIIVENLYADALTVSIKARYVYALPGVLDIT